MMTEDEFWEFMQKACRKGRVNQVSARIDSANSEIHQGGKYLQGHALLPADYDKIPEKDIIKMSNLLFEKKVKQNTKEAVLMILAHHVSPSALMFLQKYCLAPDEGLKFFAEIALSECEMWNE